MPQITIREHEEVRISSKIDDQLSITEECATLLRNIESELPKGALSWGHNKVKFSQFCGVIQLGNIAIEILPKIYGRESETNISRDILIQMLYVAQWLIPKSHGAADLELRKNFLLDVFINHFCSLLFEQIHQGLIRIYQNEENNLPVIRGRILLNEHLKINTAHKEKVYCSYDELQVDNEYNQAIRATLRLLFTHANNIRLRQRLNELLFIFSDISDRVVTSSDVKKLPLNRLIKRYEHVLQMCEWFLSGLSPDIYAGKHQVLSLLFDMNRLFEAYIGRVLRKVAVSEGMKLREQGPQKYLAVEKTTNKNIFLMKPDMTLMDKLGNPKVIFDTKWKLLDSTDNKYGISQADMYQMLAYAQRYECNDVVLIYPQHKAIELLVPTFNTIIGDITIHIWTVNLAGLAGPMYGSDIHTQLQSKLSSILTQETALVS